jgi:DNA-binding protein HU-beta
MTKAELIDAMALDAEIPKAAAKKALDSFTTNVSNALTEGKRVSLIGFGSFSVSKRAAREGRNPQTGATIKIAEKAVARFKPGAELTEKLNS